MSNELKIYFNEPNPFNIENIKPLYGVVGLYFIFSRTTTIDYPFKASRLLYIGMSEKKTSGIGNRLNGHFEGKSKNVGLVNYKKKEPLFFTYLNFEMLKKFWDYRIEDLESYFILRFVEEYGVYPICNNKTGLRIQGKRIENDFIIDWSYFD